MQSALYNYLSAYRRDYSVDTPSAMETIIIRCQQTNLQQLMSEATDYLTVTWLNFIHF